MLFTALVSFWYHNFLLKFVIQTAHWKRIFNECDTVTSFDCLGHVVGSRRKKGKKKKYIECFILGPDADYITLARN